MSFWSLVKAADDATSKAVPDFFEECCSIMFRSTREQDRIELRFIALRRQPLLSIQSDIERFEILASATELE